MSSSWCAGSERSRRSTPSSSANAWCVRPPTKTTASAWRAVVDSAAGQLLRLLRGRRGQLARPHAGHVARGAAPRCGLPVALREEDVGPAAHALQDAVKRRDLVESLHAGRVAPRGEPAEGVVADHRDRLQLREVERQHGGLVLEQDDPLPRDAESHVLVRLGVDRARAAAIEPARRDQHAQVAAHLVVEHRDRERAVLQPGKEGTGEEVLLVGLAGAHLEVEALQDGLAGVVGSAPVGDDAAREAPLALEHLVEQVVVVAHVLAADLVVGAHNGERPAFAHSRLERRQVDLPERPLVHLHVDRAAVPLLVVGGVVLEAGDRLLGLHALHVAHGDAAGEPRVFAEVVVVAAAQRRPLDVQRGAEDHVLAARAGLVPDRAAVGLGQLGVPGRREGDADRHRGREVARPAGRLPRVDAHLLAHALRSVGGPQVGHAEALDAAGAELAIGVDEADLLLEREAGQQVLDACLERAGRVEVGRAVLRGDTAERAGREARGGGEGQGDEGRQGAASSGDSRDDRRQAAFHHVLLRDSAATPCWSRRRPAILSPRPSGGKPSRSGRQADASVRRERRDPRERCERSHRQADVPGRCLGLAHWPRRLCESSSKAEARSIAGEGRYSTCGCIVHDAS